MPSDVTAKDSLDLLPASDITSRDDGSGEDDSKKIQNLYKRINELEVVNDTLRQKLVSHWWMNPVGQLIHLI